MSKRRYAVVLKRSSSLRWETIRRENEGIKVRLELTNRRLNWTTVNGTIESTFLLGILDTHGQVHGSLLIL